MTLLIRASWFPNRSTLMIAVFGRIVASRKWRKEDIVLTFIGRAPKSIRQIIARKNKPCPKTATNSDGQDHNPSIAR